MSASRIVLLSLLIFFAASYAPHSTDVPQSATSMPQPMITPIPTATPVPTTTSTLQDWVSLTKDIVTTLSALTVAIIAALGLRTWKNQLTGKTEYELARRLLRASYRVRDPINLVREPFMPRGEIIEALKEANIEVEHTDTRFNVDPGYRALNSEVVYRRRWKRIEEAMAELDLEAFEAEVIWGSDVRVKLAPLREIVSHLQRNIQRYLRELRKTTGNAPDDKTYRRIHHVIYGVAGDLDTNPFSAEIKESVKQIESFLRPHIEL